MKRNLLKTLFAGLFLSMLTPLTVSADVEINTTNFPDENFRDRLLAQSYGQDGKITDEEIKSITSIDVYNQNISSLQGIEHFTALTTLYCDGNQLTSLDVSHNTALRTLYCSSNQLTSLDVSYNTALTLLKCQNNQLTSLDVSQNTALTTLECWNNQLTFLDVSHTLTSLRCESNQLASLNVSRCTALTSLSCQDNQLTSLNVSGCTALTSLQCQNNQLTSLDVSGCTALGGVSCNSNQLTSLDVSHNTALTSLSCNSNQLTSLDVSHNTALRTLYCSSNQLTSLNVSGCTALRTLSCNSNQLTSLNVSGCTALTSLPCYFNQLTSLNVSGCTALTSLPCYSNQLKGISMDAFIESLPTNTSGDVHSLEMYSYYVSEGNICTRSQVAAIKAKGWTLCYSNGKEYEGSDEPTSETISVGADGMATYCSPFDLSFANVEGVKAYVASGYDYKTGTVLLTRVKEVPAGTGIMLMGDAGTHKVSIRSTQYYYVNMLKGTLTAQPLPQTEGGYTNYILTNGAEGVMFYMSSGNGNIAANRAYLQVPTASSPAGARRVLNYAFEDDETTGIEQPQAIQQDGDAVYNLNGQRVEQPRKGLYIKNGKKVFIH